MSFVRRYHRIDRLNSMKQWFLNNLFSSHPGRVCVCVWMFCSRTGYIQLTTLDTKRHFTSTIFARTPICGAEICDCLNKFVSHSRSAFVLVSKEKLLPRFGLHRSWASVSSFTTTWCKWCSSTKLNRLAVAAVVETNNQTVIIVQNISGGLMRF